MKRIWSLRVLIPAGVLVLSLMVMGLSMMNSLKTREHAMLQDYLQRGQRNIARLARASERSLQIDPQILEEDITQMATDPSIKYSALIDGQGLIRFSNEFTWRHKPAASVLPRDDVRLLHQATQQREALVQITQDDNRLLLMMSYNTPTNRDRLRSLDRGAIYLVYDLSQARAQARQDALRERVPELLALGLAALLLVWLLHTHVSRPLSRLRDAAEQIASGQFGNVLSIGGPEEIQALTGTFNRMGAELAQHVRQFADQAQHTQTILDNVIDGIITINDSGEIVSFNKAAERIFGYRTAEAVGQNVRMLMPESELITHDDHLQRYRETGVSRIMGVGREVTGQRKDGSHFDMDLNISEISLAGKRLFIGMVRDITERKAADNRLRESEQRLRSMLESSPIAARIARAGGHEVVFSNQRYAELINAQAAAVGGVDPSHYYANREDYEDILERLARGEKIFDRLIKLSIPGEGIKWALASYVPMRYDDKPAVLGWFYDITDRKRAEQALLDQKEYLQSILDNTLDGIITIDERGCIESFSQSAEQIFGYSARDTIGRNVSMLMPEPHRSAHDGYLHHYLTGGPARIIGIGREVEGLRQDGNTFPMELSVSEIRHQGRRMFIGMVRDITERKRVDRMKSEFVSTVSHELRTPLTSIGGSLGLILGGALGELPSQAQPFIEIAHKNCLRLSVLINDLLDMEKIAAGKLHFDMQAQALMPLVEQAIEANMAYAEQYQVHYVLSQRVDRVQVRVDGQRLIQVLSNFLSNAAKFSPAGSDVAIEVTLADQRVRVAVKDHGPGIPDAFRNRIFEKFSQADSSDTRHKGGTGLGLAITKELVEHMQGTVGFTSCEGQGSTFYFELPVVGQDSPD